MRKFMVLPLAGVLVLAAAAPVAAGPNTSNTSGSGRTIQGEWYGETSYGFLVLFEESGGTYGELFEESGEWVLCAPAPTPEEEVYGFVGQRVWGWGHDVQLSLNSKLTAGTAAGEFEISIDTVNECTEAYESSFDTTTVSVDVVGDGSLAMFRESGSFQVPGEFNAHSRYRGKERLAAGTADLGSLGTREFGFAIMAEYSWSEHANG